MATARPRRLGIMGGTFDPIHHGHLVAASEVADRFDLDTVVFVPTGQPWQKADRQVTPAEDRYLMTVVATASNPRSIRLACRWRTLSRVAQNSIADSASWKRSRLTTAFSMSAGATVTAW